MVFWKVTNTSIQRIDAESVPKGTTLSTFKNLAKLAEGGDIEQLEKIHEAATTILQKIHFSKGNWREWIWNILQYIPGTRYRKVRLLYNKVMKQIDLPSILLYRSLPEELKTGMPSHSNQEQIHDFFANPNNQTEFRKINTLTFSLDEETQTTLPSLILFPQLQTLTIRGGRKISLSDDINKMTKLTHVTVESTQCQLPSTFHKLPCLTSLRIHSSKAVLNEIGKSKTLKKLSLIDFRPEKMVLKELKKQIVFSVPLEELTMEKGYMDTLPEWITSCKTLRSLQLNDTQISKIPSSIGNLKNLETFVLEQSFYSSFNPDLEIANELNNCTQLKTLVINDRRTHTIPDLSQCTQLEKVTLCDLPKSLPSFVKVQKNLKELDLQFSTKAQPEEILTDLNQLETTHLIALRIAQELPDYPEELLKKNPHIQTLSLSAKEPSHPDALTSLSDLEELDLHLNNKGILPVLGSFKKLQTAKLNGSWPANRPFSLKQNPALEEFDANFANFHQSIGEQLGTHPKLKRCKISIHKDYPGDFEKICQNQQLESLSIEIPSTLSSLPKQLCQCKNLQKLHVKSNGGDFALPDEIGSLFKLEEVWFGTSIQYKMGGPSNFPVSILKWKELRSFAFKTHQRVELPENLDSLPAQNSHLTRFYIYLDPKTNDPKMIEKAKQAKRKFPE